MRWHPNSCQSFSPTAPASHAACPPPLSIRSTCPQQATLPPPLRCCLKVTLKVRHLQLGNKCSSQRSIIYFWKVNLLFKFVRCRSPIPTFVLSQTSYSQDNAKYTTCPESTPHATKSPSPRFARRILEVRYIRLPGKSSKVNLLFKN